MLGLQRKDVEEYMITTSIGQNVSNLNTPYACLLFSLNLTYY